MSFTVPKLPYDYSALEPSIDATTMEIHYGKHHQVRGNIALARASACTVTSDLPLHTAIPTVYDARGLKLLSCHLFHLHRRFRCHRFRYVRDVSNLLFADIREQHKRSARQVSRAEGFGSGGVEPIHWFRQNS